jgi:hypothetical protein
MTPFYQSSMRGRDLQMVLLSSHVAASTCVKESFQMVWYFTSMHSNWESEKGQPVTDGELELPGFFFDGGEASWQLHKCLAIFVFFSSFFWVHLCLLMGCRRWLGDSIPLSVPTLT